MHRTCRPDLLFDECKAPAAAGETGARGSRPQTACAWLSWFRDAWVPPPINVTDAIAHNNWVTWAQQGASVAGAGGVTQCVRVFPPPADRSIGTVRVVHLAWKPIAKDPK